jgi:hypothetical protein
MTYNKFYKILSFEKTKLITTNYYVYKLVMQSNVEPKYDT